jgi:hypothetical protein
MTFFKKDYTIKFRSIIYFMSKHIIIATLLATAALILLNAPTSSTSREF